MNSAVSVGVLCAGTHLTNCHTLKVSVPKILSVEMATCRIVQMDPGRAPAETPSLEPPSELLEVSVSLD